MLPTFLVIGAMKAATTSLWAYLRAHPMVFMAPKEPNFFAFSWERGLDWYEGLFDGAGGASALGDVSPSYTSYPGEVPVRIRKTVPEARLIYSLRDPVARVKAHYLHARAGGREKRSFERAIEETPWYVTCSKYALWTEHYLEHFPSEQVLLMKSEDLRTRREETLDRILWFLDIESGWRPPNLGLEKNVTADKRVPRRGMSAAARCARSRPAPIVHRYVTRPIKPSDTDLSPGALTRLREELAPDVARLRAYMPPGFDGWGIA